MEGRKILVAFDGTEESRRSLEQAVDVARETDARIGVVTVMSSRTDAPREALTYLRERGLLSAVHLVAGDPVDQIARVVEAGGYSTVFLGSFDGSVARRLSSRLSRRVALRAPVSVAVAR